MSGGGSQTTNTVQNSQTQPWLPSIGNLTSFLNQIGNSPTGPTSQQLAAIQQIMQESGQVPQLGPQGANAVSNLFNVNTGQQQGDINQSIGALSPMLQSNWMNPATNPYLSGALSTLNQDITNQVGGAFAAAGRPIGTNAAGGQALARGLSQGEAGLLTNEFNTLGGQQLQAAGMMPGQAGALTAAQLTPLMAGLQGMQSSSMLPGMFAQPGIANLSAAGLDASSGTINLPNLEQLTIPIAGLGAQSQGNSTSTTTGSTSPWSNIIGGTLGGIGLLGGTGAFGSSGWLGPLMSGFLGSDENIKSDIKKVGALKDGSNVYSFRYKGDPTRTTHVGLLAQEVEQTRPDAVAEFGGVKYVDYRKATEKASYIGLLEDMLDAA